MTIHNAVPDQKFQSQLAIMLEAGTIIWSTEGVPVAEIARHLLERRINWFAPEDGSRTEVRELSPQFLEPMNSLR